MCRQSYSDESLNYAKIHPGLGETEKVFAWLEKALKNALFVCRGCWLIRNSTACATIKDSSNSPKN
ncbi:MAG: hypothetical protein ACR2F2_08740 [Pyrinomonadaceae bacterium]